jgi:amino acid adenylation domain-containing protein/thioester reductase-like protein
LEQRLQGARTGVVIEPRPDPAVAPLSAGQQRLWFLDQLEPGNPAYNVAAAVRLRGRLLPEVLQDSLRELVARHEILRASFPAVDGVPMQRVAPGVELAIPLVDLTGVSAAQREVLAAQLAAEQAVQPFDLGRGPLLRAELLQLGGQEHVLLLTAHHIVCDGWSVGVAVRELGLLYEALSQGRPTEPPPAIQYADFAAWQRRLIAGQDLAGQRAYWREKLAGSPVLELPTDRPRPPVPSSAGARVGFELSAELRRRLEEVAREQGATLFMVLLAGFKALLCRYTGQTDVVVGSPVANRRRETEGLIGFFVNTLVLRTGLGGDPSFRELVGRVKDTALAAYAHQDLPFEQVVELVAPAREMSHTPLFQALFVYQHAQRERLRLPGLSLEPLEMVSPTAKFDLTLELEETGDGALRGWLEYRVDLFDPATIQRLAGHLQTLLAAAAADPDGHLSTLPLLAPTEREQLLAQQSPTATPIPPVCLHQLVTAQAARAPAAPAVECRGSILTYGELERRSNQLAHHLRALGAGPGRPVAISVDRSAALVVGILAILKSGAAYLPVDLAYPPRRVAYMLDDAAPEILLVSSRLAPSLPPHRARVVLLDRIWEAIRDLPEDAPHPVAEPADVAYVLYTSGSTGEPRGVMLEHRAAVNLITWALGVYRSTELRRVLLSTSASWDLSVFELFAALASGGTAVLVDDVLALSRLGEGAGPTLVNTVPSAMSELLRLGPLPASVRVVNLAGEPLTAGLACRVHRCPGVERVLNLYGPTETTTYSTAADVPCDPAAPPSIGRPIANTEVYVLDRHLEPVPVAVVGELHIGGAGLARGYLNRPRHTAARFVPHPFSATPGARLYRTGDLARWLPDGTLAFLGRADHQTKLRGFRVELGEVETRLAAHPEVAEAVAVVREDPPGDRRLVAYVVAEPDRAPTAAELRRWLSETLPAYMLPQAVVMLGSLPHTPNGKVDRRALPTPGHERPTLERAFIPPRTPVEETVAGIWTAVLGVDPVGVTDDFFALGGHSLLATRIVARIRQAFGIELPVSALFQAPTVAGLAAAVTAFPGARAGAAAAPDLEADAQLGADLLPMAPPSGWRQEPGAVLLTGATGFLGGFVLRELLEQTKVVVYCLVKAAGDDEAAGRLQRRLESFGLYDPRMDRRVVAVPGDLTRPLLGLDEARFDAIAAEVDAVYHGGALVNAAYPYHALKPANVDGTREVIRLACRRRAKPLHHVSTIDVVAAGAGPRRLVRETDPLQADGTASLGGYAQSKWVAERLVRAAGARGLPVAIYRPGHISGDSRTGVWSGNDHAWRLLQACLLSRCLPDVDWLVELTPVDFVSRAIVHLARQERSVGKVFHLVNPAPMPLREIAAWASRAGYRLRRVAYRDWLDEVLDSARHDTNHPLHPLIGPLGQDEGGGGWWPRGERTPEYDCTNTWRGLQGGAVVCPPVDDALLETYWTYLTRVGLIEPPRPDH